MNITEFVIDNCVRQSATEPKDYIGMTLACTHGLTIYAWGRYHMRDCDIYNLADLVTGGVHRDYRSTPVYFVNGNEGAPFAQIPRLIEQLLAVYRMGDLTPDEFYREFERIHPFVDGNGRVGAILYNVLRGKFWENPPEIKW